MAKEDGSEDGAPVGRLDAAAEGVYIVGTFLGVKRPEPYDIDGSKGTSSPKFGVDVDGAEYSIVCADERELYALTVGRGLSSGDRVVQVVFPKSSRFGIKWQTSPRSGSRWE